MKRRGRGTRLILQVVAGLLVLGGAALAQPAPAAAPAAPRKPAARRDEWPKMIPFGELTLVLYAPQAESLDGTSLKARGAFQVRRGEGCISFALMRRHRLGRAFAFDRHFLAAGFEVLSGR